MRTVLAAVLVAAALAPAAAAKGVRMLAVVGANGHTAYQPAAPLEADLAIDPSAAAPVGPFLLVFPVNRYGVATDRGRYYPAEGVVCFEDRGCTGEVRRLHRDIPAGISAAGWLPRFTVPQPTIVALRPGGAAAVRRVAPIVELALTQRSRRASRPARCTVLTARWSGGGARPTELCLGGGGLWAAGRLYGLTPRAYATARA